MTGVKRLIIADSHVGHGDDDDAGVMSALVRRAADEGVGEIIYLGDGFQYLIGMSKFWTTSLRAVMDTWREVRARGVRIVVVEGNRDFFLDEEELAREIDWGGRVYEFSQGGVRYRLDHGDLVNRRDLQYRFWSWFSKCAPARLWARWLPKSMAVSIVRRMEAHLATTNKKYRYTKPISDLKRAAERAWREGIDVLFWGHFHSTWEWKRDNRLALIIPAWLETRRSILVDADGSWTYVDSGLNPYGNEPER